jgi:hypothetical protein
MVHFNWLLDSETAHIDVFKVHCFSITDVSVAAGYALCRTA